MMSKSLKIALVQGNPTVGAITSNAVRILTQREQFPDADLVVFPEMYLSGYPLEDLVLRGGFITKVMDEIREIARQVRETPGPAILFGAPIAGADLPRNAAVLIRSDGTVSMTTKTELPNNDVFDEVRTFAPSDRPARPLSLDGWSIGTLVCEDMWHGPVARTLSDELADILISINGSPFEVGKYDVRLGHARKRVFDTGLPLIYLNMVGGQDELIFDGGSFALDAEGHTVAQLPFGDEAVSVLTLTKYSDGRVTLEPAEAYGARTAYPDRLEQIYRAGVIGLRDYIGKIGARRVILGLSGGIDSAVVAAMAADALGGENVVSVMMPSDYTSQTSLDLATDMAKRISCVYRTIPISQAAAAATVFLDAGEAASPESRSLAEENIQARLRGLALMAISNAEGGIVVSTGNKSEMSVGYSTLYGDMCGGFNPLKDIYKTDVWAIARWRNENVPADSRCRVAEPIPPGIIDRPPTAELKDGQSDEASLGSYEVLDALLRGLIEKNLDAEGARRAAEREIYTEITQAHALRIAGLVKRAEYKRRQAPPGVKMSGRSLGKGWRYPIANAADL